MVSRGGFFNFVMRFLRGERRLRGLLLKRVCRMLQSRFPWLSLAVLWLLIDEPRYLDCMLVRASRFASLVRQHRLDSPF